MMNFFKKYWVILLIGLILRLVIAGFTFHPDVRSTSLASSVPLQFHQLDFYDQSACIVPHETLDDLPLSYLISIPFHLLLRPLISLETETTFLTAQNELYGTSQIWIYLIYTKFPLILIDLALGILLFYSCQRKRVLTFWMVNPFTLWATAAIGQFDIYPTFFILLAYFMLKRGQLNWAAFSLGMGGAIKAAPFLLLPLLLGVAKNWKERFLIVGLAAVPYLVTVIPYLFSREFRANALLAPQLSKILYANLPISGGESILIVPVLLVLIYLIYLSKKRGINDFLNYSITTLLLVFSFTHFHLQWFLWVMPLILVWIKDRAHLKEIALPIIGLVTSLVGMLFLFDSSLQLKLFAPIIPQLDQAKGLAEILTGDQVKFLRSLFASIFAGASFYIIWRIFKERER